ncbi:MAG: cyclic nucleotide-binding domain-containing protein [Bacteriovorax sp.]|nr:cyclic nucleotide-binding domain-containing protein [Bacteriovorax sp.]
MGNKLNLSSLRPKLKSCSFFEGERNIVVEGHESKTQVVLPSDYRPILSLLDGEHTVKEISSELYNTQGQVSFHAIITTIKLLSEAQLFEENYGVDGPFKQVQEEKAPHEQKVSILNRTLFELKILNKIKINFKSELFFWNIAALMVAVAAWNYKSFTHLDLALFLKSPTGYEDALMRIFIISSILMSMKALSQAILLLVSTGTVYGIFLKLFPYSIALGINDSSVYSHEKKRVIIAYGVLSSCLYLISFAALDFVPFLKPYRSDFAVMSIVLTFIELNPYRRSDLTKLFFFFYAEAQLKNIMPYLQNCTLTGLWKDTGAKMSDEIRYVTYSIFALAWAIGFSLFSFEIILKSFPNLFYQIQLGQPLSKYSAIVVVLILFFICGHLLLDLAKTLVKNIISPMFVPLMNLKRRAKVYNHKDFNSELLKVHLKKNMLWAQLSDSAIDFLIANSKVRAIKEGNNLITQGDRGRDVYFLLKGRVNVTVRENTGRFKHIVNLGANTVIGELAILEKCKRTANVTAAEEIVFLELPEKVFAELMSREEFKDDYHKLKTRIQISQFVASARMFKDFPPEVMNLFVEAGDLVIFPRGHNIVDEGEDDKTFYLLIKGKVDVYKGDQKIAELGQGDFFGEVALIANVPRTASIHTVEESLFLYIEDKKFWKILSENIELAMYIESVSSHRTVKAA